MSIRLHEARLRGTLVRTRVPFRFGITEVTELVHAILFATFEIDGTRQLGIAAENLAPKWFTKNPDTSYAQDLEEMTGVIESACAIALERGMVESVFELWYDVDTEQAARRPDVAPLLSVFGVSLVERAAIDAFCRTRDVPFARAVRENTLGIRLDRLHATLAGREPRELLPGHGLSRMHIRHTVGLSDALAGDAAQADGLPATLEASIRQYGLRRFKVKVSGDREFDLDRLGRVREVLGRETRGDYRVTLDANEQFADISGLRTFWEDLAASRETAELCRQTDYVEQPLPRGSTLSPETAAGLAAWPGRPAVIVDEADDSLEAVARAIETGYDGGSFKSCKGVFKGIGNACLLAQLRAQDPSRGLIYSAEDLSTIGPVGLLADLAVIATLGIDEPERNGHHYLRPLAFPGHVLDGTLRHHGDLYLRHADGYPVLRIQDGRIDLGTVIAAPFGVGWRGDFSQHLESLESLAAAVR